MTNFEKASRHFNANLPFAVYCKPDSEQLIGIFQRNKNLHFVKDFDESGFVFAPFNGNEIVLIPENDSEILIEVCKRNPSQFILEFNDLQSDEDEKIIFENLVDKGIDAIRNGALEKVVLSRSESVDVPNFDLIAVFERLLNQYPSAFAYCFFHPEIGLWLGAFSERLLKMDSRQFQTMAVAGTQLFQQNAIWGNKEKAEQQFVTDFIVNALHDKTSGLTVSEPYTLTAGNLMHIKTDIKGTLNTNFGLSEIIQILHPTPAVCGFPKDSALNFILSNEGYDRKYYSGFLGEFNKDFANDSETTDLYVNLRCFEVKDNMAVLFIGGGVTKDSIPEKEWLETVNKTYTMKRILKSQS